MKPPSTQENVPYAKPLQVPSASSPHRKPHPHFLLSIYWASVSITISRGVFIMRPSDRGARRRRPLCSHITLRVPSFAFHALHCPGVAGHSKPFWAGTGNRGALDESNALMLVLPHSSELFFLLKPLAAPFRGPRRGELRPTRDAGRPSGRTRTGGVRGRSTAGAATGAWAGGQDSPPFGP